MEIKYCYITKTEFSPSFGLQEYQVEGRDAAGHLLFGFRTSDFLGWKEKARRYTPRGYIAAFDQVAACIQ